MIILDEPAIALKIERDDNRRYRVRCAGRCVVLSPDAVAEELTEAIAHRRGSAARLRPLLRLRRDLFPGAGGVLRLAAVDGARVSRS